MSLSKTPVSLKSTRSYLASAPKDKSAPKKVRFDLPESSSPASTETNLDHYARRPQSNRARLPITSFDIDDSNIDPRLRSTTQPIFNVKYIAPKSGTFLREDKPAAKATRKSPRFTSGSSNQAYNDEAEQHHDNAGYNIQDNASVVNLGSPPTRAAAHTTTLRKSARIPQPNLTIDPPPNTTTPHTGAHIPGPFPATLPSLSSLMVFYAGHATTTRPPHATATPTAALTPTDHLNAPYKLNTPESHRLILTLRCANHANAIWTYWYAHVPDWSSAAGITAISRWRNQVRARATGGTELRRQAVVPFTEEEKRLVQELVYERRFGGEALRAAFAGRLARGRPERTVMSLVTEARRTRVKREGEEGEGEEE